MKHHNAILKAARALELILAAVILLIIAVGAVVLFLGTGQTLLRSAADFSVSSFLSGALLLVMGIEFVKMLALHSAGAVIDVLLFTIVRQMIVTHGSALDTLLGVAAVAAIFAVKKFLQSPEREEPRKPET